MIKTNVKIGQTIYFATGKPFVVDNIVEGKYPIKIVDKEGAILFVNLAKNEYNVFEYFLQPATHATRTPAYYAARPNIKRDDYIMVKNYNKKSAKDNNVYRHFSHFDDDGKAFVFYAGGDSITQDKTVVANSYVLVDQTTLDEIE